MDKPSDEIEMFRMNLTWEDEDEVVVKLEPVDSPVAPRVGREKDLVPNEEWTRDGDICRRSYTNKRRKIPTEINEITFRVEDPTETVEQELSTSVSSSSYAAGNSSLLHQKSVKKLVIPEELKASNELKLVPVKLSPGKVPVKESTASVKATKVIASNRNVKQVAVSIKTPAREVILPGKSLVKKVSESRQLTAVEATVDLEDDLTLLPIIPARKVQVKEMTTSTVTTEVTTPIRNVKQAAISPRTPTSKIVPAKQQTVGSFSPTLPKAVNLSAPMPSRAQVIPVAITRCKLIVSNPAKTESLAKANKPVSPGGMLFLTPVSKEVVMRSKTVVRMLPETVRAETVTAETLRPETMRADTVRAETVKADTVRVETMKAGTVKAKPLSPRVPIYLRKTPDPPKPAARKRPVVATTYTGIFSCSGELTARSKKRDADDDAHEFLPLPTTTLRGGNKQRAAPRAPKAKRQVAVEREFACGVCDKAFAKRKHLYVHAKTHTGERRAANKPCGECGKMFADNTQLRIHSRVHTNERPFSCSVCAKRFKHATSLSRHWLAHNDQRPFACSLCPKTYRHKSDLVNHVRTHTDERPFACRSCGKGFNDRCARNAHERIHTPKGYKCNVCLRTFAQSTTLRGHMVTHTDERPFACVLCDMKFKSKTVLRSHERVHTAGKTFPCEVCGMLFTEKRTLTRHVYTHKEKPFPCSFCKRWYFRLERLMVHLETHNAKERPFKCDECLKCYANEGYLKLHVAKAHGPKTNRYTCKHACCGKAFPSITLLTRHLAEHGDIFVLECDVCKKRFVKKQTLTMHLVKMHGFGTYYACSKCDKTFMRKKDLTKHIRVKCS